MGLGFFGGKTRKWRKVAGLELDYIDIGRTISFRSKIINLDLNVSFLRRFDTHSVFKTGPIYLRNERNLMLNLILYLKQKLQLIPLLKRGRFNNGMSGKIL